LDGTTVERLLVLGWGLTGRAVLGYASSQDVTCVVSDARWLDDAERGFLAGRSIEYEEAGHSDRFLRNVDAIVLSPGIAMDLPLLSSARALGVPLFSELDVAFEAVHSTPIIGVTGTNGKSSTVTLIGKLLEGIGVRAALVGNIGAPFVGAAGAADATSAFVVEASSFQLEQSVIFRPDVGVLLNLAPDHLGRHGSMHAYAAAKGRLFQHQTPQDVAVLPRDLQSQFDQGDGRRVLYDDVRLPNDARRLPPHQRLNLQAAFAACRALDKGFDPTALPFERVLDALRLPFRMVDVGVVNGVRVINDSKATNPHATIAALQSIDGPIVLLLGGRHKGAGYRALRDVIEAANVRHVVLFGEAGGRLAAELEDISTGTEQTADLEAATATGLAAARSGDTLLFSPACSSYDVFRSFEERGEAFDRLIRSESLFRAPV
ncbi:Mur ligase family protein, partial [Candidatus Bipolaricaulota bacterium]